MSTSPQFHTYHCPDAPLPWCAVIWWIGKDNNNRNQWQPLPMWFFGKTEIAAGDAAEAWWRSEREKESDAILAAALRAEGRRRAKREEARE